MVGESRRRTESDGDCFEMFKTIGTRIELALNRE